MRKGDWDDYGAMTGPLMATIVLLILAFAPVLDSRLWHNFKEMLGVITPVAAALIAYFAFKIAKEQTKFADNQVRIARFEKRYAIYEAVLYFLMDCLGPGVDVAKVGRFSMETKGARFLFDQDIADYIELLRKKGINMVNILSEAKRLNEFNSRSGPDSTPPERARQTLEVDQRRRELFDWFNTQAENLNDIFFKYLVIERPES